MAEKPATPTVTDDEARKAIEEEVARTVRESEYEGKTKAQIEEDASKAAHEEARKQGYTLSDEDVRRISNGLADEFDRRGAFERSEPTPATSPAPVAEPNEPGTAEPDEPAAEQVLDDTPPQKKTLAERFFGVK